MRHRVAIERVEGRRLLSFARPDPGFAVPRTFEGTPTIVGTLDDGGLIVNGGRGDLHRYSADGSPVRRFGKDGVFRPIVTSSNPDEFLGTAAVDPASGAIAYTRVVEVGEDASQNTVYEHTLYLAGSRGTGARVAAPAVQALLMRLGAGLSFDDAGRLLVTTLDDDGNGRVTRLLPGGQALDASFGTNGTRTSAGQNAGLLGPGGSRTVVSLRGGDIFAASSQQFLRIERYGADGKPLAKFGGGDGVVERLVGRASLTNDGNGTITYDNDVLEQPAVAVAPDGSILLVQVRGVAKTGASLVRTVEVRRIRADGKFDATLTLPPEVLAPEGATSNARPLVGVDGNSAYIVFGGPLGPTGEGSAPTRASRVVRLSYPTLAYDAGFNGDAGGARLGPAFHAIDFAVDARGRLVLSGTRDTFAGPRAGAMMVLDGVAGDFGSAGGRATLLPDGTLDVAGTAHADAISVRERRGRVEVTINGATSMFKAGDVSGLIVHAGKGDDAISIYAGVTAAHVLGGAGNDTIVGSDGGDVLEGGDGNDAIDGRGGDDEAFGGAGDDTILGGAGSERLFGGAGDDELRAAVPLAAAVSGEAHLLIGGPGHDRLIRGPFQEDYIGRKYTSDVTDAGLDDVLT